MIRNWLKPAGLVVAAVMLLGSSGFGQDYSQVMNAVDKLEAQLKAMVQNETSALRNEITEVRSELATVKQGKAAGAAGPDLQSLRDEVAQLKAQLQAASAPATTGGVSEQQLATIVESIDRLNQNVAELKAQPQPSKPSTVSGALSGQDVTTIVKSIKRLDDEVTQLKAKPQLTSPAAGSNVLSEENLLTILNSIGILNQQVTQIKTQLKSLSAPPATTGLTDQDAVTILNSIEGLNQEVARLKAQQQPAAARASASAFGEQDLPAMARAVETLNEEVAQLKAQQQTAPKPSAPGAVSEQDLLTIVNSIEYLNSEVSRLRGLIVVPGTQVASLNPEDGPYATKGDVEKVARHLVNIYDRLDRVGAGQGAGPGAYGRGRSISDNLTLSGFVDASAYSDHASRESTFGLDQVEVNILKGFSGRAAVRADVEYVSDGLGNIDMAVEQGYLNYNLGGDRGWAFYFGRFESPVGFEGSDPTDVYQYSYGLVSDFSQPTNLTGIMVSTSPLNWLDWTFCVANGWDINNDNNKDKTVVTRLGFTPARNLNWGLSAITGAEKPDNNSSRRSVLDMDLTWEPLPVWLVGGELSYGYETQALSDGADGKWYGFLVMNHVSLGQRFGLTGRVDYFKDSDGLRTGVSQARKALTLAPSVGLTDALIGRLELRYDWSNADVFTNVHGGLTDKKLSPAFEFTYGF